MRDPFHSAGAPAAGPLPRLNGAPLRWTPGPDEQRLPFEEDEPVPQNTQQVVAIEDGFGGLRERWRGRRDVFVGSDQFIHWDRAYNSQTNPENPPVAPDVYVAFGVANRHRLSYVVWEEGKPPDFVLEVVSPSSRRQDREEKRVRYAKMGVPEFFWYDPAPRRQPALPASSCRAARTRRCGRRRWRMAWLGFPARCSGSACASGRPVRTRWTSPCAGTTRRRASSCRRAMNWLTTSAASPRPTAASPRPIGRRRLRWRSWRRWSKRCGCVASPTRRGRRAGAMIAASPAGRRQTSRLT